MDLTCEALSEALRGNHAAVRFNLTLDPAGGSGTKVFPPTHSLDKKDAAAGKNPYALEERISETGQIRIYGLLDSPQSQANRMEDAFQRAIEEERLSLPQVVTDFSGTTASDLGRITSFEAPHRIFDALFRDSTLEGTLFRQSPLGKELENTSPRNATPLYLHAPNALLFGAWDSTGTRGGLGCRIPRSLVSEIVGIQAVPGTGTHSRIDPLGIRKVEVYEAADPAEIWTLDPERAAKTPKGQPKTKVASDINHSNVPPTLDTQKGGVTIREARWTAVLSLPSLRRLRFPSPSGETATPSRNTAARTVLAAMGLLAICLQRDEGFDLRSRCLLIPRGEGTFELLDSRGEASPFSLSLDQAFSLLREARNRAEREGLTWADAPVVLRPSEKLLELIAKSRSTLGGSPEDEA